MRDRVPIIETRGRCWSGGETLVLTKKAVASLYIPKLFGLLWNNRCQISDDLMQLSCPARIQLKKKGRKNQKI